MLEGLMDLRTGAEGGGGEIDRRGGRRGRRQVGRAFRQNNARPAPLAALDKSLLPQLAEGAGDGRPADVEGRRQLALAGQARL